MTHVNPSRRQKLDPSFLPSLSPPLHLSHCPAPSGQSLANPLLILQWTPCLHSQIYAVLPPRLNIGLLAAAERPPPSTQTSMRYLLQLCFSLAYSLVPAIVPILTLKLFLSDLIISKARGLFSIFFQRGKSVRENKVGESRREHFLSMH